MAVNSNYNAFIDGTYAVNFMGQTVTVIVKNGIATSRESELEAKLTIAMEALEEINKKEISSQRPGGGYSKSATLSYQALEKIKGNS